MRSLTTEQDRSSVPAYYFDTSALVKLRYREDGHIWMRQLIDAHSEFDVFFISALAEVEGASAIYRYTREGRLTPRQANALFALLLSDFRWMVYINISDAILSSAVRVVKVHGLRAYDAVHLASALEVARQYRLEPLMFVFSDRQQLSAAQAEGIAILDPTQFTQEN